MKKILLSLLMFSIALCALPLTACRDNGQDIETTDGYLYTLRQAYENELITYDDLLSIAYHYHSGLSGYGGTSFNEEIMGNDYTPAAISPETLSKARELSVKQSLLNNLNSKTIAIKNLLVSGYYGTYGGCVAVTALYSSDGKTCELNDVCFEDEVAGVTYYYPADTTFFSSSNFTFNNRIMIWRDLSYFDDGQDVEKADGNFYTLQQAYDGGLITFDDLLSIAYHYHSRFDAYGGTSFNEEIMGEDYRPAAKSPETLSRERKFSVRQSLLDDLNAEFPEKDITLKNVLIGGYYGTYDGCIAVNMLYSFDGVTCVLQDVIHEDEVAGVTYHYPSDTTFFKNSEYEFNNRIMIWKAI